MGRILKIFILFILASSISFAHPADWKEQGFHIEKKEFWPAFAAFIFFSVLGLLIFLYLNRKKRAVRWKVAKEEQGVLNRAYSYMWLIFYYLFIAFSIGLDWDKSYHATQPFEDFYSAPHLFIYSMVGFSFLLIFWFIRKKELLKWFGRKMFFGIPAPLIILCGGAATIMLAGFFDSIWHTAFGLDETNLSFPHSMLGWGFFIIVLGMVSCVLAINKYKKPSHAVLFILALLIVLSSAVPIIGPLYIDETPQKLFLVSKIPILKESEAAQHVARIYMTWNLTRTHPLFILLSALWMGLILSFIMEMIASKKMVMAVTMAVTFLFFISGRGTAQAFGLLNDPRFWVPLPLLIAALIVLAARYFKFKDSGAWIAAGITFAFLVFLIWSKSNIGILLVILAGPLTFAGAKIGSKMYEILANPTKKSVIYLLLICSFGIPFLRGIIDLILRSLTP